MSVRDSKSFTFSKIVSRYGTSASSQVGWPVVPASPGLKGFSETWNFQFWNQNSLRPLSWSAHQASGSCTSSAAFPAVPVFPHSSVGKESACSAGDLRSIPGWEDPLEKEMATHSSTLAWRIPWIEEPSRLQSMGSQESDTTWWLNHQIRL